MLDYTPNLAHGGFTDGAKPDNSEENCNLVVKGLNPEMVDSELETYFKQYGPIKGCKISKDPITGASRCYGFVWFQSGKDANSAMLDFKGDRNKPYALDWYKILAQRPSQKIDNSQSFYDQISVTWRRIDYDSSDMSGITEQDLRNYYQKVDSKLQGIEMVAPGKAVISFSNCNDA